MIFDALKNRSAYENMHPSFRAAFDFLERAVREDLPVGKYEIDGTALYASVQEYTTKLPEEAKFEGHRRYIDIQYIQSGVERMELSSPDYTSIVTEYNAEKDVAFFAEHEAPTVSIVHAGEFGLFFPQDVHKPGLAANGAPSPVKKILVKIAL